LDAERIRPGAYALDGQEHPETYVLGVVERGWAVWYSELGRRVSEECFDTEAEACAELLLRLMGDPTTRIR
jgi:hypothetical protein